MFVDPVGGRGVDVEGDNIGLNGVVAPNPGAVVFGGQPEGHADAQTEGPAVAGIEGIVGVGRDLGDPSLAAIAAAEGGSQNVRRLFGGEGDVGDDEVDGRLRLLTLEQGHACGVEKDGARIVGPRRHAGKAGAQPLDALF